MGKGPKIVGCWIGVDPLLVVVGVLHPIAHPTAAAELQTPRTTHIGPAARVPIFV